MKKPIRYYVRGSDIERPCGDGTKKSPLSYRWHQGWNAVIDNKVNYPAVTKKEARAECMTAGCVAVFIESLEEVQ